MQCYCCSLLGSRRRRLWWCVLVWLSGFGRCFRLFGEQVIASFSTSLDAFDLTAQPDPHHTLYVNRFLGSQPSLFELVSAVFDVQCQMSNLLILLRMSHSKSLECWSFKSS